jgi:hypothetical protein
MEDGEAVAFEVAKTERRAMLEALAGEPDYQEWCPAALEVNWEDPALICAHTGQRIPSAYAEPEEGSP